MRSAEPALRLLVFERGGRTYALPGAQVGEISLDRSVEPVPLAPSAVAGLAIERGRLLTVVELDRMLRIEAPPGGPRAYLVALAAPFAHLALRVRAEVRLEREDEREPRPEVLDVERIVQTLEAALATGRG